MKGLYTMRKDTIKDITIDSFDNEAFLEALGNAIRDRIDYDEIAEVYLDAHEDELNEGLLEAAQDLLLPF